MVSDLEKVQSQIKEVQKDVSRKILFVLKRIVHLDQNRGHESCLHGLVYVYICVCARSCMEQVACAFIRVTLTLTNPPSFLSTLLPTTQGSVIKNLAASEQQY